MALGLIVVEFDAHGLALPFHHLNLVEQIGVIDLLKVELQLVFVRNRNVQPNQHILIVIESFPESGQMLVAVPFCKVSILQLLL